MHVITSLTKIPYKIKQICIALACILGVIILRLFHLQILLNQRFITQGEKNFLRINTVPAARGSIFDRFGTPLATNRVAFDLYWHGTGNHSLSNEQLNLLKAVCLLLEKSIDTELVSHVNRAERRNKTFILAQDLSFEQLSKIEELCGKQSSLSILKRFIRYYPFEKMASHLIGYLGMQDDSLVGKTGIEKIGNTVLTGKKGTIELTINSLGSILKQKELQSPTSGGDLILNLDATLQHLCHSVFPADKAGAFLIIDPEDGALLASLSQPDFDPSLFLNPITPHEWRTLQAKNIFLNRAFNASYPPGSLFKLVTASTALELGITTPHTPWHCDGFVCFGNRNYWCARHQGHGELTIQQALALSCNAVFYELAKQLSIDALADYAHCFGLGYQTGIILPEQNGLVPTTHWKQLVKGEPWWQGETLSVSIGQSFLLTTPLQIARFIASIFTGYLVKPRILYDEPVEKTPLAIRESTRIFLQNSMKSAVTQGTGKRINKIADLEVYAKTSTAQTSTLNKRSLGESYLEHGWLVGHCSYKNNKPITFVIIVENAGSSRIPTDIAKSFLLAYRSYMKTNEEFY